jgi:zinc protease
MRVKRLSRIVLAVLLGLAPALMAAESGIPRLDFTDTRLENGLRVIIAPEHSAPVVAVAVTYDVGSRNERPGRTGFAHLFEHMMFEGSENVGKGEHFLLVFNNGGGMNGETHEDFTNYYQIMPKNQLDLALFLESDRMHSLALNQANLDNQRKAVQEERRFRVDNQPYEKAYLEIDNLAYDNFAYKHSTIGYMADLDAANLQDVKDFFRVYYAPDNAILTVVGDVDPQVAMEKIKKYFGAIPSQTVPKAPDLTEPEHYGERREVIDDPLARLPMLLIAYHIPKGDTPENNAALVLANVLGSGRSSRLYQHLVKDKQLAAQVQVQADWRIGPSLFYVLAIPRPGVKPEDLEKAIYEEIDAVKKDGISDRELEKARMQFRRNIIQSRESALTTATRIGEYTVKFNDPNLINTAYEKLSAVTADQVKELAQKYLIERTRAVVYDLPTKPSAKSAAGR